MPAPHTSAPLLLALDTATRRASVAICRGEALLAEGSREVSTHSEGLMPLIDETLRRAEVRGGELDAVVCGRGPGSFTGLRIGMATAKGLCLATDRPLLCVSSLLGLAWGQRGLVAAVLDARRKEVYFGLFRDGVLLGDEAVCAPGDLSARLPSEEPVVFVGDGALAYREQLRDSLGDRLVPGDSHVIEARRLCLAALSRHHAGDFDDLATAVPLYVRPSDARLPAVAQNRRDLV